MEVPGIRNNNPGNIRKPRDGKLGTRLGLAGVQNDPNFYIFVNPVYGIRAIACDLLIYQKKYSLKTIRGIINRWAPPSENNTAAYIKHLADAMDVSPDTEIDLRDPETMTMLVMLIILHECGKVPYSQEAINAAIKMAFDTGGVA